MQEGKIDSHVLCASMNSEFIFTEIVMNTRMILILALAILSGCGAKTNTSSAITGNPIASADELRAHSAQTTRDAVYFVLPDVDDPRMLTDDKTFLEFIQVQRTVATGFALVKSGMIFTNEHVIKGGCITQDPQAIYFRKDPEQGGEVHCLLVNHDKTKVYRAKVLPEMTDHVNDIAVLKIEGAGENFPTLTIGVCDVGAEVFTIGSPIGNANQITYGHVSNLNFSAAPQEGEKKGPPKTMVDMPVLPGNSGGPLVRAATGEVCGQVDAVFGMSSRFSQTFTSIGFANRPEDLKKVLDKVKEKYK